MKYFDLHCDTPFELYERKTPLASGGTHITAEKVRGFEKYAQIMDIWSQNDISGQECYEKFFKICDNFTNELDKNSQFCFCRNSVDMTKAFSEGRQPVFLGIEGGKLLCGDISRLDVLYAAGARFFTLVWKGDCEIGGAHDTENGLTDFGRKALERLSALGMAVDLSHASDRMTEEATEICKSGKIPAIASHSSARAVTSHRRNLTDELAKKIAGAGGIIGVCLAGGFLSDAKPAHLSDAVRHILHYLDIGLEKSICIGADLDGATPPEEIRNVSDMPRLFDALVLAGVSEQSAEDIFFYNAERFICRYM
mgnify:FL=1